MDYDPRNLKKTTFSLAYHCAVGTGVVFAGLLTALPTAWQVEDLRRPFAIYLSNVLLSLISSVVMLLVLVVKDDVGPIKRKVVAYMCLAGIAVFSLSSIWFTAALVTLSR